MNASLQQSLQLGDVPPTAQPAPQVILRKSPRALRYRLSLRRDGCAVLTIPANGSERQAHAFLEQQTEWLARARRRLDSLPRSPTQWTLGSTILFRGTWLPLEAAELSPPHVVIGANTFRVRSLSGDLRPTLEAHFLRLARIELPARTWELAARTGTAIKEVIVRNQRTRWGSCSSNGTISLNWRLIQAPHFVSDYIVLHELMHLREMNHSARFWNHVADVCPRWEDAEQWLKRNGPALGL